MSSQKKRSLTAPQEGAMSKMMSKMAPDVVPGAAPDAMRRRTLIQRSLGYGLVGATALGWGGRWAWGANNPERIKIGGTISQSGFLQSIVSPFPKFMRAWVDDLNAAGGIEVKALGRRVPIEIIIYDDQTSPPTALQMYERLATVDKVDAFIGPYSSFLTNAALQASLTHRIPFFMTAANDEALFEKPNPWRTSGLAPATWEARRVAELYAQKRGVKTFAILGRENLHERGCVAGLAAYLRDFGFEVVYFESAPKTTKDFSSIVVAMRQKKPDVVVVESISPPWTIGFLKAARELGLAPKDVVSVHTPVPVIKALGRSAERIISLLYFFEGSSPDHQRFRRLCGTAGFEPWQYSESGIHYRAFRRIEDAYARAPQFTSESLREAMWETDFTLFGAERMIHDEKGFGTDYPYPAQVIRGQHESLWPLAKGVTRHQYKNGRW